MSEDPVYRPPLLPAEDAERAGQFAAARRSELAVQRCRTCGRLRTPPRPRCPWCGSPDREWSVVSGRGRVWSYAVPHPPLLPGFAEHAPYNVVVVELDEDPTLRVVGNLVAHSGAPPNSVDAATIEIGESVVAVFPRFDDVPFLQWVRPR